MIESKLCSANDLLERSFKLLDCLMKWSKKSSTRDRLVMV